MLFSYIVRPPRDPSDTPTIGDLVLRIQMERKYPDIDVPEKTRKIELRELEGQLERLKKKKRNGSGS